MHWVSRAFKQPSKRCQPLVVISSHFRTTNFTGLRFTTQLFQQRRQCLCPEMQMRAHRDAKRWRTKRHAQALTCSQSQTPSTVYSHAVTLMQQKMHKRSTHVQSMNHMHSRQCTHMQPLTSQTCPCSTSKGNPPTMLHPHAQTNVQFHTNRC